ncbi:MAG: YlxR family protein [Desulfocapsa sp.]|nr:YlxR family protein [Desulfocapsa sp.]
MKMRMSQVSRTKASQCQPVRTCCVCRTKTLKVSLDRFVLKEDKPVLDEHKVKEGRGAYCCHNERCQEVFLSQQKRWKRALKVERNPLALKS